MGCVSGYCSSGSNIILSKDKLYSSIIIANDLANQMYSNKTTNKYININTERQDYELLDNKTNTRSICRHALSNKELKIPDNPLPFVKIKPKKDIYY